MKKAFLTLCVFALSFGWVAAQEDWVESDDSIYEYNCDVLADVLEAIEEEDFSDVIGDVARVGNISMSLVEFVGLQTVELLIDDDDVTFDSLFEDGQATCNVDESDSNTVRPLGTDNEDTFNVVVVGNVNLRDCGSTDCDIVGQAANDSVLTVLSQDDDWYEVEFEGDTAYIASWLTERGPDVYVEDLSEIYNDERTGCLVVADTRRGDMDMKVIIFGDERNDVIVDLFRPNDDNALDVDAQYDKTFTDTGEPYIHQFYHWGLYWYTGVYEVELSYDGETSRIAWNADTQQEYNLYVSCD